MTPLPSSSPRPTEEEKVGLWLTRLERLVAESGRFTTSSATDESNTQQAETLAELQATAELLRRGLTKPNARTFRGRTLVDVRCAARGHLLAVVYPSRHGPLLVPAVTGLGLEGSPGQRFSQTGLAQQARQSTGSQRDGWIHEYALSETDSYYLIEGMTHLSQRHRNRMHEEPPLGWSLLCRCGERKLLTRQVIAAIDQNAGSLQV